MLRKSYSQVRSSLQLRSPHHRAFIDAFSALAVFVRSAADVLDATTATATATATVSAADTVCFAAATATATATTATGYVPAATGAAHAQRVAIFRFVTHALVFNVLLLSEYEPHKHHGRQAEHRR
jgi:hypothetical protein